MIKSLGKPLASVFNIAAKARNKLYDEGVLPTHRVEAKVVSVGNITVGGTGKTPITDYFVKCALKRQLTVATLSRGYKGEVVGVERVDLESRDLWLLAQYYGDEPTMLAMKNPNVAVFVGRDKVSACRQIVTQVQPHIIFADDALQHRRLHRDIEIVILDATEKRENYQPLPAGRAREGFDALERADWIIINKVNLAEASQVKWLYEQIARLGDEAPSVVESEYIIEGFVNLANGETGPLEGFKGKSFFLASGIGNPASFRRLVENFGVKVVDHADFPDHYHFGPGEAERLIKVAQDRGAEGIIVTEKDAVKLKAKTETSSDIWICSLAVRPKNDSEMLNEIFAG